MLYNCITGVNKNMYECIDVPNDFIVQYKDRKKWGKLEEYHTHNCYEFYYLIEGDVIFSIGDKEYKMKPGSVIMLPPGMYHKSRPNSDPRHRRILIYVKEDYIKTFTAISSDFMQCFNKHFVQLMKAQQKRIESLLDQLLNEFYRDDSNYDPVIIKSLVGLVFGYINRYISENENFESVMQGESLPSGKIADAINHINTYYADDITLSSTAQALGINPSYLSRSFKISVGCNFSDYLTATRINRAAYLLLNTNKNVTEIAFEVGYNSSNHFCKTFRRMMGISPLKYRKMA